MIRAQDILIEKRSIPRSLMRLNRASLFYRCAAIKTKDLTYASPLASLYHMGLRHATLRRKSIAQLNYLFNLPI